MTTIHHCPNELKAQIEILREEMHSIAISKGLSNEHTIKISQKLDNYIAIYSTNNIRNEKTYPW